MKQDQLGEIVQRMIDHPEVVAHSRARDGVAHFASARLHPGQEPRTLCGEPHDSLVSWPKGNPPKFCAKCLEELPTRSFVIEWEGREWFSTEDVRQVTPRWQFAPPGARLYRVATTGHKILLDAIDAPPGGTVVDPFAGKGA